MNEKPKTKKRSILRTSSNGKISAASGGVRYKLLGSKKLMVNTPPPPPQNSPQCAKSKPYRDGLSYLAFTIWETCFGMYNGF